MPSLISAGSKYAFEDLQGAVPPLLEGNALAAAKLIAQWLSGENTFLLHTSGSTGQPKEIWLHREKIIYSARLTAGAFGLQAGDSLLCCLSTTYIAGFMMVMRALVMGCELVVSEPQIPSVTTALSQETDFVSLVPLQMQALLENDAAAARLNNMKAILLGGGQAGRGLIEKIRILKAPVYQSYGMTETYTHVAIRALNGPDASEWYSPLHEVEILADERGCLGVRSPLTEGKTLWTNDLVEIKDDDSFRWLGRIDNVINSGGLKIQTEKVDLALGQALEKITGKAVEAFTAGIADERLGQKLIAIIEWPQAAALLPEKLKKELENDLSHYEIPKEYYLIPAIARTHTGKPDRNATLQQLGLGA